MEQMTQYVTNSCSITEVEEQREGSWESRAQPSLVDVLTVGAQQADGAGLHGRTLWDRGSLVSRGVPSRA
jgi:hypothetical protein